jgi:hypothetical protein
MDLNDFFFSGDDYEVVICCGVGPIWWWSEPNASGEKERLD